MKKKYIENGIIFFDIEEILKYLNYVGVTERISGFNEEVLVAFFVYKWFSKRKDNGKIRIGFELKRNKVRELMTLSVDDLSLERVKEDNFLEEQTLSDFIFAVQKGEKIVSIDFQLKSFPRENRPDTVTEDLINLLDRKRQVDVKSEVLIIYSHFTVNLDIHRLHHYLSDYPYQEVIHAFWTDREELNFLKLKPSDGKNWMHANFNRLEYFK